MGGSAPAGSPAAAAAPDASIDSLIKDLKDKSDALAKEISAETTKQ